MFRFRIAWASRLAAFFAVLCFAGDIVADAIADARGNHCISQSSHSSSQHDKTPCSHCSCAVHVGAVVITNSAVRVSSDFQESVFILIGDESPPRALPAAIDHPPQLI
jgi:hypothetical protein